MKKGVKILIIIGIVIVVLAAAFMITVKVLIDHNNKPAGTEKETLSASGNSGKALVVYQPSKGTGITKNMAMQIAKGINSKGYEVTLSYPGKHLSMDISQYSIVVFGSPIYVGKASSVLKDYIKSIPDFTGKKVILFTSGSNDNSKELNEIGSLLKNVSDPV
jgi:flavodoxin